MNWFQYTKKALKKSKIIQWIQLTFPVPMGILTAQLLSKVVSYAVGGEAWHVAKLGGCLLCIVVAEKLVGISIRIYYEKTSSAALHACKMELFRQFLANPMDVLFASDHGAAVERLNDDFNCIITRELSAYSSIWTGLITAAAYFCYLSSKKPLLALCMAAMSVLQIVPPLIVKHFLQVNYDNCREIEAEISDFTAEGYHGFATMKLYDLKEWWLDRLKALHGRYLKIGNRSEAACAADNILTQTVENLLTYGTYAMVGIFVLSGYTTMQDGVAAIALSSGLYAAVNRMTGAISQLSVAQIAHNRLSEWIAREPAGEARELKSGGISMDHLTFSYGEGNVINGISAEFPGENISVIKGRNGIGKSTLFKIITGLVSSEEGAVLVGGENPRVLADSQFPYALCYLPQEDVPFDFTAMELYQMLLPHKTDKALSAAAKFGLTDDVVRKTKIRELSGGEKKKVFLSLAFSLEPLILLLDEPGNSLDSAGKDTLRHYVSCRGKGTVIITHDDMFDDIADKIYFLNQESLEVNFQTID